MLSEGKVYAGTLGSPLGNDVPSELGLGLWSQTLISSLLPRYADACLRGQIFSGATAATGVAPGTALGTTAAFTLANPAGSNKNLIVIRASCGYISGTIGAGVVWFAGNSNPAAAAVTGTAITVVRSKLSASSPGNAGLAFTTATLPAAPTPLRPWFSTTALVASTAVGFHTVSEDLNGEFVISPGCSLTFHGTTAAGSSPLVVFGATWMEVDAT